MGDSNHLHISGTGDFSTLFCSHRDFVIVDAIH